MKLIEGDCLEVLKNISDNSVDCIIADLPYARLGQVLSWDVAVDLEKLWPHLWRVCKKNSPIFLFADFKFATHLIQSQPKYFRYEIVWVKNKTTTPLLARKRFGMCTEYVLVFYKKLPPYYYLNHHKLIKRYKTKAKFASCIGLEKKQQIKSVYEPTLPLNVVEEQKGVMKRAKKEMRQNYEPKLPVNVIEELDKEGKENMKASKGIKGEKEKYFNHGAKRKWIPNLPLNVVEEGENDNPPKEYDGIKPTAKYFKHGKKYEPNLPLNVVEEEIENEIIEKKPTIFKTADCVGGSIYDGLPRLAPGRMYDPVLPLNVIKSPSVCRNKVIRNITEKPQKVLKQLLKYYTKEGDVVLDFCMGSGSCGIACLDLNREFIGIEMKKEHFEAAKKRLDEHLISLDK